MKYVVLGAHLRREDIVPVAEALEAGPLFLSAIAIEDDRPLGDRKLLIEATQVRQRLLERGLFVAVRYGLAVSTAEEAAAKCRDHLDRWRELLEKHRDHVEMTLKVVARAASPKPRREQFRSGGDYLRSLHAWSRSTAVSEPFRHAVEEEMSPLSAARQWQHRGDGALELSLLVPRESIDLVLNAGASVRARFPDVPFLLSGPWPLETYADRRE